MKINRDILIVVGLTLTYLLNLFDLFSTTFMISAGLAREVNPLMKFFMDLGTSYFVAVKVFMPMLSIWAIWTYRTNKFVLAVLVANLVEYSVLVIYQVVMMLNDAPIIRSLLANSCPIRLTF